MTQMTMDEVSGNPYVPAAIQTLVNQIVKDAKHIRREAVELWKQPEGIWRLTLNGNTAVEFIPVRNKVFFAGKEHRREDFVKKAQRELTSALVADMKGML